MMATKVETIVDEALALSLSWEEISECNPLSLSSSTSSSLSVLSLQEYDNKGTSVTGHWDLVSHTCDDVKSLSSCSLEWTYRDALLFSSKGVTSSLTKLGSGRDVLVYLSKPRNPTPKKTKTKYLKAEDQRDEMNEHLLDLDENCKPMSGKQRRKFEQSGRRQLLHGHTGRMDPRDYCIKRISEVGLKSKVLTVLPPAKVHYTAVELAQEA